MEWDKPLLTIGRDSANDLIIDHPLASRRHARFERDENGYFIRDLESTNGTYVNGERIDGARALHNQDTIWVADVEIIFSDPGEDYSAAESIRERQQLGAFTELADMKAADRNAGHE